MGVVQLRAGRTNCNVGRGVLGVQFARDARLPYEGATESRSGLRFENINGGRTTIN